jgi:hypothetical protein
MNPSSFPSPSNFSVSFSGAAFAGYGTQTANLPGSAMTVQPQAQFQVQALMGAVQELLQVCQGLQQAWAALVAFQGPQSGAPLPPGFQQAAQAAQFGGSFGQAMPYGGAAQFGGAFAQAPAGYAGAFAQAPAGYAGAFAQAPAGYAGAFAQAPAGYAGAFSQAPAGYAGAFSQAPAGYAGAFAQAGHAHPAGSAGSSQALAAYGQVNLDFGYHQLPGETQKMWDVWFDSKEGQKTVQRSPIVLDLNKNGKADITGKNITGDGKIDGPTTLFDLDPNSVSYEFKSQQRRPGSGAPAVAGGHWVDSQGNPVKNGPPKGTQNKFNGYQYLDKDGALVGEMKDGLYHYGKQEKREVTEWLAKNGGDGFLVADFNGDGQISSAVELFGTAGSDGSKYQNGYEKLAALYDKNRDGQVNGQELNGLQIWADSNADGQVQQGELQSLQQHDITNLNVRNYDATSMESSFSVGGQVAPYFNLDVLLGLAYAQQAYSNPNSYFQGFPQARPALPGYYS